MFFPVTSSKLIFFVLFYYISVFHFLIVAYYIFACSICRCFYRIDRLYRYIQFIYPYAYFSIELIDCTLLSLTLNGIFLTSSVNTLLLLVPNLYYNSNINLFVFCEFFMIFKIVCMVFNVF